MKIIYKYRFDIADIVEIELPYNSRVISIQKKFDLIYLWAIIDNEERSKTKRRFYVFGTGNPIIEPIHEMKHISTVLDGFYVWHIFE